MGRKRTLIEFVCIAFFSLNGFSQDVPELLKGVWENDGRYVSFEGQSSSPQIVLRAFYGWYNDRAAENASYSEKNPRDINSATAKSPAQEISMRYIPLTGGLLPENAENSGISAEDEIPSGAWNIEMTFPGRKEVYTVPVAVIGENLYLRFALRHDIVPSAFAAAGPETQGSLAGFWQDPGNASGILISPPVSGRELLSYYVTEQAVYKIRYWQTGMDFDGERKAVFSDGAEQYSVPAHLKAAGKTFACVTGRRSKIRNIEKTDSLPQPYTLNSVPVKKADSAEIENSASSEVKAATICALGEPYLRRIPGKTMEEILADDAKKVRPSPPPLFPPRGVLEFDWSIVEDPPQDYNRRVLDLGK